MSVVPQKEKEGEPHIYMAPLATRNGTSDDDDDEEECESFHKFFECWLVEQNQDLEELVSASKNYQSTKSSESESSSSSAAAAGVQLRPLIDRIIKHYEHYYRAKSRWAEQDVFAMLTPSWRSTLEDAFLWIGGWRPSMAFHLLYSKSGLQLEPRIDEVIGGLSTGDLADLSRTQLRRVDELQRKTIRDENELTQRMAEHQETVADSSVVELSNQLTELMRTTGEATSWHQVESTLAPKEEGLEKILRRADDLRLRTLKDVLGILTLTQAVHFLIAAAELHLRLHDWGKKRDDAIARD